jgi:two-component system, sensor histidine kinase PdtaS
MGKVWQSGCCLLVLLLSLTTASAQLAGSPATPLRFQSSPVYHPPSYYPVRHQRLLLQLSSTEFHVFRNAEIDLDSSLIHASSWLGISRLPVIDEGFEKALPADSLPWFDCGDPAFAVRSLPAAHGPARLRELAMLGAYYAFQPAGAADHKDSALFYLQAARTESRLLKESSWDRQVLCLMGKFFVQGESLQRGNGYFDECIRECSRDGDLANEAKAWAWRGLYTRYSAATTYDRIASLEKARAIYRGLKDAEGEINVLTNIGYLYVSDIQLKKGEEVFKEALRLEDSTGFAYTHYTTEDIAMAGFFGGKYGEPLSYALQSVKTAEILRDSLLWGAFYQRLSNLYDLLDDKVGEVAKWAKKAFDRFLLEKGDAFLYVSAWPVVKGMIRRHEDARALAFVRHLATQQPPRSLSASERYHFLLGLCYEELKQYDSAEVHTLQAAQFTKKLELLHGTILNAYTDYRLGELYFKMARYGKAKQYFQQYLNERIAGTTLATTLDVYEALAKIDSVSEDYPALARHLQTYISLQKSNLNTQGQRQAEELAVRYETERKEQQIGMLQQADLLRQSRLSQTLLVQRMTITGICVLLVIAGLLLRQNRQRKKMNQYIEQKNDVITSKNEMLVKVLGEKEWLLKEVNHRVKNNLQTVISLLESQGRYLKNEALHAIVSSQHRVYAMLLLHQKIYQAEKTDTIEMSGYLDDIIHHLRESFDSPEFIRWRLDIQPLKVGLRKAVPIALILNESVTNSLKHAFPAGRHGLIAIRFRHEKGKVSLSISDNGVGLSRSPEEMASESVGIVLMKGLSEELQGNIQISSDNGTTVSVQFHP